MTGLGWWVDMLAVIAAWIAGVLTAAGAWIMCCLLVQRGIAKRRREHEQQQQRRAHIALIQPGEQVLHQHPRAERLPAYAVGGYTQTICDRCGAVHPVDELIACVINGVRGRICHVCCDELEQWTERA